jgi:hypothetical protein
MLPLGSPKREQHYLDFLTPFIRRIGYNILPEANVSMNGDMLRDRLGFKVLVYDWDGKFVERFKSVRDAVKIHGSGVRSILKMTIKYKPNSKYVFIYEKDKAKINEYINHFNSLPSGIEYTEFRRQELNSKRPKYYNVRFSHPAINKRTVIEFDIDTGRIVKVYESLCDARNKNKGKNVRSQLNFRIKSLSPNQTNFFAYENKIGEAKEYIQTLPRSYRNRKITSRSR